MDDAASEQERLEGLSVIFSAALEARRRGLTERARELLRLVLRREPRLAEPHLELAHIAMSGGRLDEAELEAREGLRLLETGGAWVDDLPEDVLRSHAHNLLAELLRQRADSDEVIFGDPERFRAILAESRRHFSRAATLDPDNDHAGHHDFYLGLDERLSSGEE